MEFKLVSIIVPVYNAEVYLQRCIDSILAQSYENLELILVNDGSKDDSGFICEEYAKTDLRIKVLHQENQGPSIARNNGINQSNGELLKFVDADDIMNHCMIERLLKYQTNVDLVLCGYKSLMKINDDYIEKDSIPACEGLYNVSNFMENFFELYKQSLINPLWNKLYNVSIIKSNKIRFREGIHNGEDLLFNIEYLKRSRRIYIIQEALYCYINDNPLSITRSYKPRLFENGKTIYNELCKYLKVYLKPVYSYQFMNEVYTNQLLNCLENIFHGNNGLSYNAKKCELNKLLEDEYVFTNIKNFNEKTKQERLLKFLLKTKSVKGIFFYFGFKNLLKKYFKNTFKFFKNIN